MLKKVIWSPLSINDLESITDYLNANWEIQVVNNFIDTMEQVIYQISLNPRQYPLVYKKKGIRKCVVTKHNSFFYREREEFIDILRIFDSRQDPKKLKF